MKEKILVTGGTGYIGSHTVVELQNAGYEVVIIDNLSNSSADVVDNIEKVSGIRPAFEELDCLDYAGLDAVFTKYKGTDPEVSSTGLAPGNDLPNKYPTVRTFTFGLNISF